MFASIFWWIYTGWVWFYTCASFTLHALIVWSVGWMVKDRTAFAIKATYPFFWGTFNLLGMGVKVFGAHNVPDPSQNFIVISNHQSLIDIPVLIYGLSRPISFIAKDELLRIPVLGWDIRSQGHVSINRHDPRSAVVTLKRVEQLLESGRSFVLFPEGTRSVDGKIGDFKKGAFMMAVNTGTTILPCYIGDSMKLLHKRSLRMHPGMVKLVVGKPIPVPKYTNSQDAKQAAAALSEQCHAVLVQMQRDSVTM